MHEINLLPPQRRQSLQRTTLLIAVNRILASLLWGASLVMAVGVGTIGVFWALSIIASGSTQLELQLVSKQYQDVQKQQAEQSSFLTFIQSTGQNRLVWSQVLKDFFAAVPPGVTISSLSGKLDDPTKANSKPTAQILFGGQAVARSTLTIFSDRLQLIPGVTAVDAPTSNLIERDNPTYTFKLTLGTVPNASSTTGQPVTPPKTAPNLPTINGPAL